MHPRTMTTAAQGPLSTCSLDGIASKPHRPGKEDTSDTSEDCRSKQGERLVGAENEQQNLDDAVGPTVRTRAGSHSQNAAPAKQPQLELFHRISVVTCSALQCCLLLGTRLLSRLGMPNWLIRLQAAQDSGAGERIDGSGVATQNC